MKATIFRIITMFFLVLTFISIFNFSNQDGQTSGGLSRKVARKIVDVCPYTKNLKEETKKKNSRKISTNNKKRSTFIYLYISWNIYNELYKYIQNTSKI